MNDPLEKLCTQKLRRTQIYRKTNISYALIDTRTSAYQGVGNVVFREILRTC